MHQSAVGGCEYGGNVLRFRYADETDRVERAVGGTGRLGQSTLNFADIGLDRLSSDGVQTSFANGVADFAPNRWRAVNSVVNQILR